MTKEVEFVSLDTDKSYENATVRLSINTQSFDSDIEELLAKIHGTGGVTFTRFVSRSKARHFHLSSTEVSSLIEALQAFQQKRDEARQAEQAQLEADLAEAKALVKSVKTELDDLRIIVSKHEQNPEIYAFRVPAFGIERSYICKTDVLRTVKDVIDTIEYHIAVLERDQQQSWYQTKTGENVKETHKAQIAAWRTVRPLPVETEPVS